MNKKQTAKIAKSVILGKNKPTLILRFLCWFTIIWDGVLMLYFMGSGLVFWISKVSFEDHPLLHGFTKEYCFTLAIIHFISLFAAILMYRLKKNGFYIYIVANISLVVAPFYYLESIQVDYIVVVFTLAMIGLFASQFKKLS